MKSLFLAAALALTGTAAFAAEPKAAEDHAPSADQKAAYDAWPTDQRGAFDTWPHAQRTFYWSLNAEQQKGFWRLTADQRALVVSLTPEQQLRAWETILAPSRKNVMAALARN